LLLFVALPCLLGDHLCARVCILELPPVGVLDLAPSQPLLLALPSNRFLIRALSSLCLALLRKHSLPPSFLPLVVVLPPLLLRKIRLPLLLRPPFIPRFFHLPLLLRNSLLPPLPRSKPPLLRLDLLPPLPLPVLNLLPHFRLNRCSSSTPDAGQARGAGLPRFGRRQPMWRWRE
jgi:hypothetical protein